MAKICSSISNLWRKVVSSDEKKFNLDGPNGFQKHCRAKKFLEKNYSTRRSEGGSLMIWGAFSSSGKLKLKFVRGQQKGADYMNMLNDFSLRQEECCL